jgi:YfiH family protein
VISADLLADLPHVRHGFFTREGGVSGGIFASLNCGYGSGDDRAAVAENRDIAARALGRAGPELVTGFQVHGTDVAAVESVWAAGDQPRIDGMVTDRRGIVLGILTADCAPVLLADQTRGIIGAAHAGWKGAFAGIVEATIAAMERLGAERSRIRAVIGPCIGRDSYEVGPEFRTRFVAAAPANEMWFRPSARPDHALFDLAGYLGARIAGLGIAGVSATGEDTAAETGRFFSYRRTCLAGGADYGRMVSAITLA